MKTKVVYILSSNSEDILLEELFVSVCSLKYYTSSAFVSLVMDKQTSDSFLDPNRNYINKYIDEKIVIDFEPSRTTQWMSRWMKTNLRNLVSGDFLYIDLDTSIAMDISQIDDIPYSLAMVPDSHMPVIKHPFYSYICDIYHTFKIECNDSAYYFNSGVIYCKDVPQTYEFFDNWHKYWQQYEKSGFIIDQPSLAKVNSELGYVDILSGEWNCQLRHGMNYFYNAIILHYLGTSKNSLLATKDFLSKIKDNNFSYEIMSSIYNPKNCLMAPSGLICEDDFYFHYSDEYRRSKKNYDDKKTLKEEMLEKFLSYKNSTNGLKNISLRAIGRLLKKM